jgi:hypothetical protein
MSKTETNTKKILILDMLEAFPASPVTDSTLGLYASKVEGCSVEAVGRAANEYGNGRVPDQSNRWAPSPLEFANRARLIDDGLTFLAARGEGHGKLVSYRIGEAPPEGMVPLGPTRVDFGSRAINLEGMSHAEKEEVLRLKRPLTFEERENLKRLRVA